MYHNVSVIVLFALLASAMGRPNKEEWEAKQQKCIEETGVTREQAGWAKLKEPTSDPKVKCYRTCMMKSAGYYKADSTLDLDKAIAKIPADNSEKDKITADLKECAAKKGANACETGYETMRCIQDKKIFQHIMGHRHHKHD